MPPEERTISLARQQLFELFTAVTENEGTHVVIAHRRSSKKAVLVSRSYLEHLERVATLRRSEAGASFELFGSATITGSPEDVLAGVRHTQHELARAKAERLVAAGKRAGR